MSFRSEDCSGAALGGHIDVLKYLKSEGMPFDEETCASAIEVGDLEILKYLKSEGVTFDEDHCYFAAEAGDLDVLKWLRSEEVKCPWDPDECFEAAMRPLEEAETEEEGVDVLSYRAELLDWIEDQKSEWTDDYDDSFSNSGDA